MPEITQTDPLPKKPDISIVIPTFRRVNLLERLLNSLVDQKINDASFEIVVVDNSPSGDRQTVELCKREKSNRAFNLTYAHQPERGTNEARNLGIVQSKADLVGFIDDDETLPVDWVAKALSINKEYSPDCFGGPYIPNFVDPKPIWFKEEYHLVSLGQKSRWLDQGEALLGGNMVYQRRWLEEMGGFAHQFGRSGFNLGYGDDTDFMLRIAEKGARLWYDPDLYILHYTPADRLSVRWFLRSKWLHGKAKAHIHYKNPANRDDRPFVRVLLSGLKVLGMKCLEIGLTYMKLPLRNRQSFPYAQNYVIEMVCPQISGFSTAWHLFRLNLARGRGTDKNL